MMPGENENILIRVVDDDAHMRGSLEFMLTAEGFAVKTYPSAQAFLTDDAPSRPGCLILDVKMDGMTGLELQEEMIRRGIRLPVVFLSPTATLIWRWTRCREVPSPLCRKPQIRRA